MNARHVVPQEQHKPWCSHSWTIRCVRCVTYGALRSLPDLRPFCICYRRYTSRTSRHRPTHHIPYTCRYRMCSLSSSILSQARPSATLRFVLFLSCAVPISLCCSWRTNQVGDGLEIYVVVAKGRSPQGLESMRGVQEMSTRPDGDRVFVIRRELKKD